MRILSCFKITHDLEHLPLESFRNICRNGLDLSGKTRIFGNYDETALEIGLVLGDALRRSGNSADLTAITVGQCEQRFSRRLFAAGYGRVVCAQCPAGAEASPKFIASAIRDYVVATGGFDAILAGSQAGPFEHGQVPFILAASLCLPSLTGVIDIAICDSGFSITGKNDSGIYSCDVAGPSVYVVGDARHAYLRMPTLREQLAAAKSEIEFFTVNPPPNGDDIAFQKAWLEEPEGTCTFIEADTMEEKVQLLWDRHLKELMP